MFLDILGATLGLLYLWLEVKENVWMWLVGSVMPVIYIVVLYQAGLYADCGMEVYYFLAGMYGLWYWLRHSGSKGGAERVSITTTPRRQVLPLVAVTLVLWAALVWFLFTFTDSRVPYVDGFTTALSIVAMWMLSRKYTEQWLVWFVVDAISAGLYVYKGVYGRAILYSVYTIMAVYGYLKWRRACTTQAKS